MDNDAVLRMALIDLAESHRDIPTPDPAPETTAGWDITDNGGDDE